MSPDTRVEVVRLNTRLVSSLIALGMLVFTVIAGWVRLEYRADEAMRANARQDAEIKSIQSAASESRDRLTRMESDLKHVLSGVEEIKQNVKR